MFRTPYLYLFFTTVLHFFQSFSSGSLPYYGAPMSPSDSFSVRSVYFRKLTNFNIIYYFPVKDTFCGFIQKHFYAYYRPALAVEFFAIVLHFVFRFDFLFWANYTTPIIVLWKTRISTTRRLVVDIRLFQKTIIGLGARFCKFNFLSFAFSARTIQINERTNQNRKLFFFNNQKGKFFFCFFLFNY